jgi:hypothetical protein
MRIQRSRDRSRNRKPNRQAGSSGRGFYWPIGKTRRFLQSAGHWVCIIRPTTRLLAREQTKCDTAWNNAAWNSAIRTSRKRGRGAVRLSPSENPQAGGGRVEEEKAEQRHIPPCRGVRGPVCQRCTFVVVKKLLAIRSLASAPCYPLVRRHRRPRVRTANEMAAHSLPMWAPF